MVVKIAWIDGDKNFAKEINNFIRRFNTETGNECALTYFNNGLDFISDYQPIFDIVVLDIALPLMDGLEVARRLRAIDKDVPIIFATSMAQMAIKGYEVNALDFLVKPIAYATFAQRLQKALDYVHTHGDHAVVLKMNGGCRKISARDIKYIEVFGHFLIYHLLKEEIQVRGSLSKAEEELAPFNFLRCNDCYLINLRYVNGFSTSSIFIDEQTFPISRRKKKEFKEKLTDFLLGSK